MAISTEYTNIHSSNLGIIKHKATYFLYFIPLQLLNPVDFREEEIHSTAPV